MADRAARRRIWGWYFFDWASQPYWTLLVTFIFGPYFVEIVGDGAAAQSAWGFATGAAGLVVAFTAPILGAIADTRGNRIAWMWVFSVFYVIGSAGVWFAAPDSLNVVLVLGFFALGLAATEYAVIVVNSMLPDLGPPEEIGKISGNGWAFGYLGGLVTLILMLGFFAESGETGKTLLGLDPPFGLDPEAREGTRAVGPLSALWYIVFMVPFFLFVRDTRKIGADAHGVGDALSGLWQTIRSLPRRRSLFAYLGSSMLYRDALAGLFAFGGIYAAGVLGWSVTQTGIFGIITIITSAISSWLGGRADSAFGPKPVIRISILVLLVATVLMVFVSRTSVAGIAVAEGSNLPDISFYIIGAVIGSAAGVLSASSRTMMVRQGDPERMTEAFGLYALAGKATSFIAPFSIGIVTAATGSQQAGIVPLIFLFLIGFGLLVWVQPDGDRAGP